MPYKTSAMIFGWILLTSIAHATDGVHTDFDVLCSIFNEAREFPPDNIQQRSDYISDQVDARITSKEVIETFHAMFNMAPDERFELLTMAAEHYTGKTWNCPGANKLLK